MARKKTNAYTIPGLDLDYAPYSVEWLNDLTNTVELSATISEPQLLQNFAGRMNDSAKIWRYHKQADKAPSELSVYKALVRIHKLCAALVPLLPIVHDEGTMDGEPVNHRIIDGIGNALVKAMENAQPASSQLFKNWNADDIWLDDIMNIDTPRDRLPAMVATLTELRDALAPVVARPVTMPRAATSTTDRDFALKLAGFYEELFVRKHGRSRDAGTHQLGGPFLRFVSACFAVVGDPPPSETIASWIRDWRASQEKQTVRT